MAKIGFKGGWDFWMGGSSESKWEKSLFGGFRRLVSDYPRVVIDWDVDFDFAPISSLTYLEKEKIMKIFLSKAKTWGQINLLIKNASTTKESSFIYGNVIKTVIDKKDKASVIDNLNSFEKEYVPLFNHYRDFIIDSDISFKRPEKNSGGGKSDQDQNDQDQDGDQDGDGQSKNNNESEDKNKNQDGKDENKEQKQTKSPKSGTGNPSDEDILKNLIEFEKALNDIKEEEIKFNSLSTFNRKTNVHIQKNDHGESLVTIEEKNVADNLTKMLDISFDPTSDTVKNLRIGKLDICKIAEVPAGNIAIYKAWKIKLRNLLA